MLLVRRDLAESDARELYQMTEAGAIKESDSK
jgi:hypothetical protein